MAAAANIGELVGNTPMVKLNKVIPDNDVEIYAKLEFNNPSASVKDRPALAMIVDAESKGSIDKNTVIIEPTSGNTGIGLAMVCAYKGYRLILTMPESMSTERRKMMEILGAEIVLTEAELGMKGAVKKAEKLLAEYDNSFMPQQFKNPANPQIHFRTTAEEIWRDTGGDFEFFAAGVGTGGTITGTGEALKSKNPRLKIIAVEPEDSPVISGGEPGPHKIQGIGAGFIPDNLNLAIIDETIKVSNENAINFARKIIREEGILIGISSGAIAYAACKIAERPENRGKKFVIIFCDTAERYLSTDLFKF